MEALEYHPINGYNHKPYIDEEDVDVVVGLSMTLTIPFEEGDQRERQEIILDEIEEALYDFIHDNPKYKIQILDGEEA